jgi:hypothetical protein
LIAGALLHDVGKLIEYEKNAAGKPLSPNWEKTCVIPFPELQSPCVTVQQSYRTYNRDPFDGRGRNAAQSGIRFCLEADYINFDTIKAFLGMK